MGPLLVTLLPSVPVSVLNIGQQGMFTGFPLTSADTPWSGLETPPHPQLRHILPSLVHTTTCIKAMPSFFHEVLTRSQCRHRIPYLLSDFERFLASF